MLRIEIVIINLAGNEEKIPIIKSYACFPNDKEINQNVKKNKTILRQNPVILWVIESTEVIWGL